MKQILVCKCGDCKHWEILLEDDQSIIKCMTCGREDKVQLNVEITENLHYVAVAP